MNDSENVKMTINIGGERIQLSVPFNKQDAVRDAEKAAAQLFGVWRKKWPARSDKEIMTMIAYQFAFFYQELLSLHEKAVGMAEDNLSKLSASILEVKNSDI